MDEDQHASLLAAVFLSCVRVLKMRSSCTVCATGAAGAAGNLGDGMHGFGNVTLAYDDDKQIQAHNGLGALPVHVLRLVSFATSAAGHLGDGIHSFGDVTLACDDNEQFQAHAGLGAIPVNVLRLASFCHWCC